MSNASKQAGEIYREREADIPVKTVTNSKTMTTRALERPSETPDLIPGYFAHIDKGKLLTHKEEIDLSKRAKAGDKGARQRLIEKNLRLVVRPSRSSILTAAGDFPRMLPGG